MTHFNWTQLIPGVTHDNVHVATALLSVGIMGALTLAGRLALGSGEQAVAPSGRFSLKGFFEVYIEFIVGLSDMVIGEAGRKFVPMFAVTFFYIWISNLIGLFPGMTPSTENINTTVGLGVFCFVVYNYYGFKEHGVSYLKHFLGPSLALSWMMLWIELISHFIRPLVLGLRLFGNMTADHLVLSIFLDLAPWGVPAIFYAMGLFVASIQAFVFTILMMIYISMAIAHDH
jgi:F-type H+-transporting ATPase subunit a